MNVSFKNHGMKILITISLLLCVCASKAQSLPDNKYSITGKLKDSASSFPVRFATIELNNSKAKKNISSVVSDSTGQFVISADTGQYILSIRFVGYNKKSLVINLAENIQLGEITLSPSGSDLQNVTVKSDRPLIEEKADRLVYNAEKDPASLTGTAADLMRNVPMLSVDGDGNLQLRGSSNIRVLINNRSSSIIANSVADALRQIPASMIKSVEVITSPSAKYDAEGTAGIVNIITKKNTLQGVTGSGYLIPGNVSTIGNFGMNYRRKQVGLNFNIGTNQFYNTGETFLERYTYSSNATFIQEGKTRNRSGFLNPAIGFDYTFNEKNSIAGGFRFNTQHDKVRNEMVIRNTVNANTITTDLFAQNRTKGLGFDTNLDYLRTFKDPQKELSFLAQFSKLTSDNNSDQDAFNASKQVNYFQRNTNASQNSETTLQSDFTQPLKNKTTLETGVKAILRYASSDVDYKAIYPLTNTTLQSENKFAYHQNVVSGYMLYGFQLWKKMNVKTGVRYEHTEIDANFKTQVIAFNNNYYNFIPSLNMSYTFKQKHTLRLNYTRRLQRPQLFFLNPYREVVSPQIIRTGNPNLNAEVAELIEMSYGTYSPLFSFNASIYTRFTNNAISSVYNIQNDTTYINYLNIASNKTYGTSLYGSVKIYKRWSLNGNLNVSYAELEGNGGLSNSGWMFSFFTGSSLDLGKGWTSVHR
jgi:hypothetical protein